MLLSLANGSNISRMSERAESTLGGVVSHRVMKSLAVFLFWLRKISRMLASGFMRRNSQVMMSVEPMFVWSVHFPVRSHPEWSRSSRFSL